MKKILNAIKKYFKAAITSNASHDALYVQAVMLVAQVQNQQKGKYRAK